jgi:hypothetical protein
VYLAKITKEVNKNFTGWSSAVILLKNDSRRGSLQSGNNQTSKGLIKANKG